MRNSRASRHARRRKQCLRASHFPFASSNLSRCFVILIVITLSGLTPTRIPSRAQTSQVAVSDISPTATPGSSGLTWMREGFTGVDFTDVKFLDDGIGWAVGTNGAIAYFDGAHWNAVSTSTVADLAAISMVSNTEGWAVGSGGTVLHYHDGRWQGEQTSIPNTVDLVDIKMVSATEGWALGIEPDFNIATPSLVFYYHNGKWFQQASFADLNAPGALDMLNRNEGWVVGSSSSVAYQYSGGSWQARPINEQQDLYDVVSVAKNEAWAVGTGTILHYVNGSWQKAQAFPDLARRLNAIVFDTPNSAWAIGNDAFNGGFGMRYLNGTWQETSVAPLGNAVSVDKIGRVHIVGSNGLLGMIQNNDWILANEEPELSGAVINITSGTVRIAGGKFGTAPSGSIYRFDGQGKWTNEYSSGPFTAIDMLSPLSGWAVDSIGSIYTLTSAGWQQQINLPNISLAAVDMFDENHGWVAGGGFGYGSIARYANGKWLSEPVPSEAHYLHDVAAISADEGWAVGDNGTILHRIGGRWRLIQSPTHDTLNALTFTTPTEGWAVGGVISHGDSCENVDCDDGPVILHYKDGIWIRLADQPACGAYTDITMLSATEGWITGGTLSPFAGSGGCIFRFSNGQLERQPIEVQDALMSVAVDETGDVWAVGSRGSVLRTAISSLEADINFLAQRSDKRISSVLRVSDRIAREGDYFAVKKTEHEIGLVVDSIVDTVGVLSDVPGVKDEIEVAKSELKVAMPGAIGSGWQHIIDLKNNNANKEAVKAFRDALFQNISPGNTKHSVKELLGASTYYMADYADQIAEDKLTDVAVETNLKIGLQSELALQQNMYPPLQRLGAFYQKDMHSTAAIAVGRLPTLTSEQESQYRIDLQKRGQANIIMADSFEQAAAALHTAYIARESQKKNWIENFTKRYLIKTLFTLAFDGPGALAVGITSGAANLYQNLHDLSEDTKMMAVGVNAIGGSLSAQKRIYLNTVNGIDNIKRGIAPQIADGKVISIDHHFVGEKVTYWNETIWVDKGSYTDVSISNTTPFDIVYHVLADYGNGEIFGGYQGEYLPLLAEGSATISAGQTGTVRLSYKQRDEIAPPTVDSAINVNILGSTDTGTYFVFNTNTNWPGPTIQARGPGGTFSAFSVNEQSAPSVADRVISYPLRARIDIQTNPLIYIPTLSVDNPFTQTVTVNVVQPLPAGVQVVDANGGMVENQRISWSRTISPETTVEFSYRVRYTGSSGQILALPPAQLKMSDGTGQSASFTSEEVRVPVQAPLLGVGVPPGMFLEQPSTTIPITITNRVDTGTRGIIRLQLSTLDGTEVYSTSHDVTLPGLSSASFALPLQAPAQAGTYLLHAMVESAGTTSDIFTTYLYQSKPILQPTVSPQEEEISPTMVSPTISTATPTPSQDSSLSGASWRQFVLGGVLAMTIILLIGGLLWRKRRSRNL